ncbi:MAG: FkbM family methyltransferase, partial [Armatimonadia bacterium]
DHIGELILHLFANDSVATASQFQAWRSEPAATVQVPTTTLDLHLLPRLTTPDANVLMKVDAEGGEFAIFRGAEELLRRFRPVLMFEMLPALANAAGWQPQDLLDFLGGYGYEFFVPETGGTVRPLVAEHDIPSASTEGHVDVFAFCGDIDWHRQCLEKVHQ